MLDVRMTARAEHVALAASSPDTERVTATPNPSLKPRADLVERALPFLPAGREIRQAFIGQAAPSFFFIISTSPASCSETSTDASL
jgi:hypothetical protein